MDQTNEQTQEGLSDEEKKELTWETNHEKIANALNYLQRKEIKTTVTNIAKYAGLSRKTVYNHINNHSEKQQYASKQNLNFLMMDEIIARIGRKASFGDVKAAQLYLELMGAIKRGNRNTTLINATPSISVNGIAFTEDMVKSLSPENLTQLEEFVRAAAQVKQQGVGSKISG